MAIIGREPPADIIVPAPQVSACHAEVRAIGNGVYVLTDMQSSNGTWVNGRRIASATITLHDDVRLGSVSFSLHPWLPMLDRAGQGAAAAAPAGAYASPGAFSHDASEAEWAANPHAATPLNTGSSRQLIAMVALAVVLLLTGFAVWFLGTHLIVRAPIGTFTIAKPQFDLGRLFVDTREWRPADVGMHPELAAQLVAAGHRDALPVDPEAHGEAMELARRLAAAIESYAVDNNEYPTASSVAELERILVPRYATAIPTGDAYGPFHATSEPRGYRIANAVGEPLLVSDGASASRLIPTATATASIVDIQPPTTRVPAQPPQAVSHLADERRITLEASRSTSVPIEVDGESVVVAFKWSSWGWDVVAQVRGREYDFYDAPHGVGTNFVERESWPAGTTRTFPTSDARDADCPVLVTVTVVSYPASGQSELTVSASRR